MSLPTCPACIAQRIFADSYRREPVAPGEEPSFALAWCMGAAHATHAANRVIAGKAAPESLCLEHAREVVELLEDHEQQAERVEARSKAVLQ